MVYPIPSLANDLLLRAFNHESVPRVPVWLMRQAGRSDPEYVAYRERAGLSLYEMFRHPDHAIPISLLPKRIGVDAIIMFQDILTPLSPAGADFQFDPGPVLSRPVRSRGDIEALRAYEIEEELKFVGETIRGIQSELRGDLPLLGFAGAPFTLAAFLIEGKSPGVGMENTFAFLQAEPKAFQELMGRLTALTVDYLNYQIASGVHAVQVFESMGEGIPRPVYERYVQPSHVAIFSALAPHVPAILFVKGSPYPDLMLKSGAGVLSLAESVSLREILERGEGKIAVQGNVDNRLLQRGGPEEVERAVYGCLAEAGGTGHILNLNHGILPDTPFENVARFVSAARDYSPAGG